MIELDVTKPKNFKFDMTIDGINSDVLTGFLRLEIGNVEYGFPAVVTSESISADIPSLKSIVNREIKNGETIKARLDVVGDGYYMPAWAEDLVVKSAVIIEAKLVESDKPVIQVRETTQVKAKPEPKKVKQSIKESTKPVVEKKLPPITKELILNFMKQKGTINETIQNVLYEQATMKIGDDPKTLLKFFINFYKSKKEEK
jgi:hypothetical protein